jgi:hypothetical protein
MVVSIFIGIHMPLLSLWSSNPAAVSEFTIEQVVATAGDGVLRDGSLCSQELRNFLKQVSIVKISEYIEQCLSSSIPKGGLILQDLVNEMGSRLDYAVVNGRYQGATNLIGYDGIWSSPESHNIIVEVKTTDAYRISLDVIARYRDRLLAERKIKGSCSILIIVGRKDTGELEAQVRGSRHAWDIRLISADALIKLVQLRRTADGSETGRQIRSLLTPMEYTGLDGLIDVMFTTARDLEDGVVEIAASESEQSVGSSQDAAKGSWQFTDSASLQKKRSEIVTALDKKFESSLVKRSRALYIDEGKALPVACTLSKRYSGKASPYWYAYHPHWDSYLNQSKNGLLVLGCMDLDYFFAIPRSDFAPLLPFLNISVRDDGQQYWHIHLVESDGGLGIYPPKQSSAHSLLKYAVRI